MNTDRAELYSRRANHRIIAYFLILLLGFACFPLAGWLAWAGAGWPAIGSAVAGVLLLAGTPSIARSAQYWLKREQTELHHLLREDTRP